MEYIKAAMKKETEAELKEILGFRKDDLFMQSMVLLWTGNLP